MSDEFKQALLRCGVDLEGTLRRFGGMEAFYEKFLMKFPDDRCYEKLRSAVLAGNVEEAFVAAHTLKGVSANLGLDGILKPVTDIVNKCRTGELDECVNESLEELTARYEELCEVLKSKGMK